MPPNDVDVQQAVSVPKPNPRNNPTMFKIFQNVQYNVVQHKKYVKEMTKLYKKLDEEIFRDSFKNALHYLFTFGDTNANIDRVVQFVATFCTSLDDEEEFLQFIFNIIFDCQCVSGQSVRYRASQLLASVLAALGDDASLDDDLCDKLLASQMQRLQDTRGAVRCRAALALQRLQNPMEQNDDVTRAYRFHMSCDPSSSVRRAIVMSIAKCSRNVPFVLERLCDVDEAVRRAAFLHIAAINITQLRVRQRVYTLKIGLTERSPRVRRVVEEILIPGWLSSFKGNIIDLLKAIRLDNASDAKDSQYVAGKLLESLFKRLPISELLVWLPTDKNLRLIGAEKLNKESAWYWRHLAEHLQKIDDDETLETILPDLVVLIGYIRAIVESPCPSETDDPVGFSTRQYVLHELGYMLKVYDATDPAGRAALQDLISDVLTGDYGPLTGEVIRAFVSSLELVLPDVTARMEVICKLVLALRDPPEPEVPSPPPPAVVDCTELKLQKARLRVSLNVALEAQDEAVREQNYALAAECKAKVEDIHKKLEELNLKTSVPVMPAPVHIPTIKEKVSDAVIITKCLAILNCAMDTPQLKSVTPVLQMIFNELETEIFQNPDVLETSLETVALYGMLDKQYVKDNKAFFFAHLVDMTNEVIACTVLRCIVDILCVHGARVFEEDEIHEESIVNASSRSKRTLSRSTVLNDDSHITESGISMSQGHGTVIELLFRLMDGNCAAYRLIIVEGLCRLLQLGHLESPSILSRLLLLWFNPATVDEDMLRQTIGVFFQTFPATVDGAQEQIQKATLPTLRALANAPSSSPLAEIDQEAVVRFIVTLTRVNHELTDSQGGMATVVCAHLVRRPTCPEAGLACRLLALLSPPRDALVATDLAAMLRDLCTKLPDKQSSRNLTRYLGSLEAMERVSLNKISNTGIAEGTMETEANISTMTNIGRMTTSLAPPIGRSTHVVVNGTIQEEVEIDEASPTEMTAISRISEDHLQPAHASSPISEPRSVRKSSDSAGSAPDGAQDSSSPDANQPLQNESDSSGVSPVKKAKVTKGKKKKLSINRKKSEDSGKSGGSKKIKKGKKQTENEDSEKCGVKRTRSQRSLVDTERAQNSKAKKESKNLKKAKDVPPPIVTQDSDSKNESVRKSTRVLSSPDSSDGRPVTSTKVLTSPEPIPKGTKKIGRAKKGNTKKSSQEAKRPVTRLSAGSTPSENSSRCSLFEDSSDDTELHTIVYDQEIQQSLLDDSDDMAEGKCASKNNVTVPETPDATDESESEPEPEVKPKGRGRGKK